MCDSLFSKRYVEVKRRNRKVKAIMKKRTILISVLMIMVLVLGGIPFSSYAASGSYVIVSTYQDNAQAKQVLKLINKQRTKRGLKKLSLDKELTDAAVKRAAEVSIYIPDTSPHMRPNGKNAHTANKRITFECSAEGYETPKDVVNGWMSSKMHKKGILLKKARSIGIGCITTDGGDTFWTLEISNSKVKKKLTSSKKVHAGKRVYAKSKYFKKSYFSLKTKEDMDYFAEDEEDPVVIIGKKTNFYPYYSSKWNNYFNSRLVVSDFKWKSGNTSVATVNSKGVVTGKKKGTAKITVTAKHAPGIKITQYVEVMSQEEYDEYNWYE